MVVASMLGGCGWQPGPEQAVRVTTSPDLPADPAVAELIADGDVTADELTEAYDAYIDCMEDAGMVGRYVFDVDRLGRGIPMEYNMPGDGREGRLTHTVEQQCFARFINPVDGLFDDPLSPAERSVQRRRDTIDCMAEVDRAFATIPPHVSVEPDSDIRLQALRADNRAIVECIDTAGIGWTEFGNTELP